MAITTLVANMGKSQEKNRGIERHGWTRPPSDFGRTQCGRAFEMDLLSGATGALVRDMHYNFVAAANNKIDHVLDAAKAEA